VYSTIVCYVSTKSTLNIIDKKLCKYVMWSWIFVRKYQHPVFTF